MRKDSSEKLTGNAQFEGYSIDLIHEISKILGFNYTFKLVPDGRYGSINRETKEWDGMIKELLDQVSKKIHTKTKLKKTLNIRKSEQWKLLILLLMTLILKVKIIRMRSKKRWKKSLFIIYLVFGFDQKTNNHKEKQRGCLLLIFCIYI